MQTDRHDLALMASMVASGVIDDLALMASMVASGVIAQQGAHIDPDKVAACSVDVAIAIDRRCREIEESAPPQAAPSPINQLRPSGALGEQPVSDPPPQPPV